MIDVPKMKEFIETNNVAALAQYMKQFNMTLTGDLITAPLKDIKESIGYWDKKQTVEKLKANGLYGALLNAGCRFHDQRMGQSTTLTGRIIARHMDSYINECITGEYKYDGDAIIYGDSVTGDSEIRLKDGSTTSIKDLWEDIAKQDNREKEIDHDDQCTKHRVYPTNDVSVLSYDAYEDKAQYGTIEYVMRHRTKKQLYEIELTDGNIVTVTEDHSLIVDRDGFTVDVKPTEILDTDLFITMANEITRQKTKRITKLGNTDTYVYDISMREGYPFFFANNVLLHNTDSAFFSIWPMVKDAVESGDMEWNKEIAVQLYDSIAEQVNASFPAMMEKECHCPRDRGSLIRGGRELVAESGIFMTKKRYAVLIYDAEGTRLDLLDEATAKKKGIHYKLGKVKAMGLDLKRSDTPKIVQDFLSRILLQVLTGISKEKIITDICEFKTTFTKLPAWEKGTPKRVNNLTNYADTQEREGKTTMPGHVRAAINWNKLRKMYNDNYSMKIVDGMKTIVCKLKPNPLGYTSVAYPIDVLHIPEWFKELPFDNEDMTATVVDKKVENLLGVLNWDIVNNIQINSTFDSLFSFE